MKELTNIKNKQVHHVSDEEYDIIVAKGWLKKYTVRDIKPLRTVNITTPEPKKTAPKKTKND